jgi:formylglycine-generating enzyme required for sulfatase activity
MMGSNEDISEKPVRQVTVKPFAMSRYPISVREWNECAAAKACTFVAAGNDDAPVTNVSWTDAKQYVAWLAGATHKAYRLPTEAEWEYAARAGTTTKFSTGDTISPLLANYDSSEDGAGPSPVNRKKTVPVGSFPPNAFGLYDMHGNVTQWVEDCWHDDYTEKAPADGTAWVDGSCDGRVLRGGSWADSESELRSAARTGEYKYESSYNDGFRIARGL